MESTLGSVHLKRWLWIFIRSPKVWERGLLADIWFGVPWRRFVLPKHCLLVFVDNTDNIPKRGIKYDFHSGTKTCIFKSSRTKFHRRPLMWKHSFTYKMSCSWKKILWKYKNSKYTKKILWYNAPNKNLRKRWYMVFSCASLGVFIFFVNPCVLYLVHTVSMPNLYIHRIYGFNSWYKTPRLFTWHQLRILNGH